MAAKKRLGKVLPKLRFKNIHQTKKPGLSPGTVEHIGQRHLDEIKITVHEYSEKQLQQVSVDDIKDVQPYIDDPSRTWIKVDGLHDVEKLKSIGNYFELHPLIQEDIVHTTQRPKVEFYENCVFFVLKMLVWSEENQSVNSEQISIVLGPNFVLSFQETDNSYFKPVLERLAIQGTRMRQRDTDYLTYALIDTVVDHYFSVVDRIAAEIEEVEELLLGDPDESVLQDIHKLRREIIFFRKSIWPLRDAINSVIRDESPFITDHTKVYLRDVYDHIVQLIDNAENYRDMILSLHDMYMSYVSNKMNEVMKVLTIIATIFIPLTFIAGIYGMNFNTEISPYNMPELNWYWGYPAFWVVMLVITTVMIFFFKRKRWL
ncbi:MAG TPA: magnesium/cobalt transporter CorA [Balneolaceae bacterium]